VFALENLICDACVQLKSFEVTGVSVTVLKCLCRHRMLCSNAVSSLYVNRTAGRDGGAKSCKATGRISPPLVDLAQRFSEWEPRPPRDQETFVGGGYTAEKFLREVRIELQHACK
jgi:hypothetical protein